MGNNEYTGPDEETKRRLIAMGLYANPSAEEIQVVPTKNETFYDKLYMHSNFESYGRSKHTYKLDEVKFNELVNKQVARENIFLKNLSDIYKVPIEITENTSDKDLEKLWEKVFDPYSKDLALDLNIETSRKITNGKPIDESEFKKPMKFKEFVDKIVSRIEEDVQAINEAYGSEVEHINLLDLKAAKRLISIKNKTTEDTEKAIEDNITQLFNDTYTTGIMRGEIFGETEVLRNALANALPGINFKGTGAVKVTKHTVASAMSETKADITATIQIGKGLPETYGISMKEYGEKNLDAVHLQGDGKYSFDSFLKFIGDKYESFSEPYGIIKDEEYMYNLVNELADCQQKTISNKIDRYDAINFLLDVLKKSLILQIGNSFDLTEQGQQYYGTNYQTLQVDFFMLNRRMIRTSTILKKAFSQIEKENSFSVSQLTNIFIPDLEQTRLEKRKSSIVYNSLEYPGIKPEVSASKEIDKDFYPSGVLDIGSKYGRKIKKELRLESKLKGKTLLDLLNLTKFG